MLSFDRDCNLPNLLCHVCFMLWPLKPHWTKNYEKLIKDILQFWQVVQRNCDVVDKEKLMWNGKEVVVLPEDHWNTCTVGIDHSLKWGIREVWLLTSFRTHPTKNCQGVIFIPHAGFWGLFWPRREVEVNHLKAGLKLSIIFYQTSVIQIEKKLLWFLLCYKCVISWYTARDHCPIPSIIFYDGTVSGVKKDPKSWMCLFFFCGPSMRVKAGSVKIKLDKTEIWIRFLPVISDQQYST